MKLEQVVTVSVAGIGTVVVHSAPSLRFDTIQYPTGNCQLSSAAYVNNILNNKDITKKYLLEYLIQQKKDNRILNILLVDISAVHLDKFNKFIDAKYIIMKNEYTSTNGSKMCIILIDIRQIVEDSHTNSLSLQ